MARITSLFPSQQSQVAVIASAIVETQQRPLSYSSCNDLPTLVASFYRATPSPRNMPLRQLPPTRLSLYLSNDLSKCEVYELGYSCISTGYGNPKFILFAKLTDFAVWNALTSSILSEGSVYIRSHVYQSHLKANFSQNLVES